MRALSTLALLLLIACGHAGSNTAPKPILTVFERPVEPSDPSPPPHAPPTLIKNATIMTAAGSRYERGYIFLQEGKIAALGEGSPPQVGNAEVIDGSGRFVTPGIIDTHSHMGVYPLPHAQAHSDGNEMVRPTTPNIWAEHGFWPQDPSLWRAVAGGVTTVQVLPGSANLIGGRSFVAKLRPQNSARLMRFPGAPQGLKIACGENPKRVYGDKGGPRTRMGNVAGYRKAFQSALEYRRRWKTYERDLAHWKSDEPHQKDKGEDPPTPPDRDFGLETLALVLDNKIQVHNHCYRADEMHIMLDLAQEYGFTIRSFHHALEAYKLADRLAKEKVAVSTWADWWGFKMEAFDGIPQNAALLTDAGARVVIHSDSETDLRHLNHEAVKAATAGRKVGIEIPENEVLRFITANPAWALSIDQAVGTLEKGKHADVVIWDGHPFSVYSKAQRVFIDGHEVYNRAEGPRISDFEVGLNRGVPRE